MSVLLKHLSLWIRLVLPFHLTTSRFLLLHSAGGVMMLLVGHWTCNSQVAGLTPGQAPSRLALAKLSTAVCLRH